MRRSISKNKGNLTHWSILTDHYKTDNIPIHCVEIDEKHDARICMIFVNGEYKLVKIYGRRHYKPGVEECRKVSIPDFLEITEIFELEGKKFTVCKYDEHTVVETDEYEGYILC